MLLTVSSPVEIAGASWECLDDLKEDMHDCMNAVRAAFFRPAKQKARACRVYLKFAALFPELAVAKDIRLAESIIKKANR